MTNGIPTYYAVDFTSVSRVVVFDQNWVYQRNTVLPYSSSFTLKYINGNFYFTSDPSFYRTGTNFISNAAYAPGGNFAFRQFFFDSNSQLFYVAPITTSSIHLFDLNCVYKRSIIINHVPFSLNIFNDNIYVGTTGNQILVVSKSTEKVINQVNCLCSSNWLYSITIDIFGFMAISAGNNAICLFDRTSVTYLNSFFASPTTAFVTAILPNGRFVVMATNSLDIYF